MQTGIPADDGMEADLCTRCAYGSWRCFSHGHQCHPNGAICRGDKIACFPLGPFTLGPCTANIADKIYAGKFSLSQVLESILITPQDRQFQAPRKANIEIFRAQYNSCLPMAELTSLHCAGSVNFLLRPLIWRTGDVVAGSLDGGTSASLKILTISII